MQADFLAQERRLAAHPEGICVMDTPGATVGVNLECHSLGDVAAGRVYSPVAAKSGLLFRGVVPDGVASVTLRYGRLATVTAAVVGNVFASRYPRGVPTTVVPQITWHAADGRVLKTIKGFGP